METHQSQTAFPVDSYIPQFDGLRGISILAVFIAHSEFLFGLPHAIGLAQGRLGVDLFFVLSGFLITGILLDSRDTRHYFRNFYVRRALRIWPLYYVVLTLVFLIVPTAASTTSPTVHVWPYFYLYIQNLFLHLPTPYGLEPTWSLAVEEQFYITWPVLVLLLRKRTLVVLLAALVILSLSLRIVGYEQGASLKFMHNFTVCRLDGLAFGSLAAIWLRSRSCSVALWQRWAWRSIAFGLIGSVLTKMVFHRQSTVISYTLVAIGFSGLLGIALISDPANSLLGRMLSAPWLRYVGRISYGLYLLHMPLFQLIGDFAKSRGFTARYPIVGNVFVAAMQFLVALAAASISWRYFESLILRLKAFFPSGSKMHWPSQFPENEASEK